MDSSPTVDRRNSPILGGENKFKLAIFGFNNFRGTNMTKAGFSGPPEVTWRQQVELAMAADEAGFDALIPLARWKSMGRKDIAQYNENFETLAWAAGISAVTSKIQIFSTIHMPLIHPLLAAKSLTTSDHISGGRIAVNVVAGWNEAEFDMFGLEQAEHDERYAIAEEWMELYLRILEDEANGEPFDFAGKHYHGKEILGLPRSVQRPYPPIMSAGSSPAGRDFAAKFADLNFVTVKDFDHAKDAVDPAKDYARETYDRDVLVLAAGQILLRDSDDEAQSAREEIIQKHGDFEDASEAMDALIPNSHSVHTVEQQDLKERLIFGSLAVPLVGTPETVTRQIQQLAEAGLDGLAVTWVDYREGISQYARDLAPLLEEAGLRGGTRAGAGAGR